MSIYNMDLKRIVRKIESLNVSVSAGILLYEILRQREKI